MKRLYDLLTWVMQPFVRYKLKRRARQEPLYGQWIEERFGHYTSQPRAARRDAATPCIWLHAVSLGETRAAAILLTELRCLLPHMRLVLTHGTATGRMAGEALLQAGDGQVWLPWDTVGATRRFFQHHQPDIGVLLETEIWPCLMMTARHAGIPLVLANARMSEQTLQKTKRLRALARVAYGALTRVYAQTQADAQRFMQLGVAVDGVFGNLKFDITPNKVHMQQGAQLRLAQEKPVVMLASSREGEERAFLMALQALAAPVRQSVQWLIVVRHPQRFDLVAHLIEAHGFSVSRRNAWVTDSIWLGDSLGEMSFYSSLASCALLGGSFAPWGGQNLIEILACGCPVVTGVHTFNFQEATQLATKAGVAFRADGFDRAIAQALQLTTAGSFVREHASAFVDQHRGAAAQTAAHIAALVQQPAK